MTIIKAILLTLFLIFVFSLTQVALGYIFYKTELIPEYLQRHIGVTTVISFVVAYLIMFKIFWKPKLHIRQSLKLENYKLKILRYLILIAIGFQLFNRPFWDLGKIWDYLNFSEFETDFNSFNGFTPTFFYSSISILFISPILEELFFRKFLLQNLVEKNNQKIGILISSLCFAIIHIETPFNLIPTFVFGIISSLIFIKTRRIGYSILLHFLVNLLVQILNIFGFTFDRWLLSLNFNFIYWIMFLIGIGSTYFGIKKLLETQYKNNA